jgi:hypothetical protein
MWYQLIVLCICYVFLSTMLVPSSIIKYHYLSSYWLKNSTPSQETARTYQVLWVSAGKGLERNLDDMIPNGDSMVLSSFGFVM